MYYDRAVDGTRLPALSIIASTPPESHKGTTKKAIKHLDYLATHRATKVRFHASSMILNIHSDASYLSDPQAIIRLVAYFFLGQGSSNPE